MMSRPGSTTIAPSPVRHQTRGPDTEQKEQSWGRNKFLICRLIVTSRVALRTQTLARSRIRREVPPVCGEPCGLGSGPDPEITAYVIFTSWEGEGRKCGGHEVQ